MKKIFFKILSSFQYFRRLQLKIMGRSEADIHEQRVVTGKAWAEFCDNLKAAGAALVYPGAPLDPLSQAEGIRYLSRLTRGGLEAFVEYGDAKFPVFRRIVDENIKMGADNPDNYYVNAQISGQYDYIISGNRNTIDYLGFFTQNGNYGTTGGLSPCGVLEGSNLKIDEKGEFEIILSKEKRGENWLKIEEDSSLLMVRQTYRNRNVEKHAELSIKAIGYENDRPGILTASALDEGLKMAGLFVAGAPMLFSKWAAGFKKHTNQLPLFDPEVSNAAGGDANIIYYHSYWNLTEDQALVINAIPPDCDNWNFQLNNYWMESLDYRYYNICLNSASAEPNPDGSITVVVSAVNPGVKNWIETAHHKEGTMCWRWYRPKNGYPESIKTEIVSIEEFKASHAQ